MSVDATIFVWKLSNKVITPIEKLILLAIADRCGERGECWPSLARLMQDTGLGKDAIIRHRQKLIEQGILSYTGEMKGRSNQIPVMRLMIDSYRESDYIDDEVDQSLSATGSQEMPAPVAGEDRYQSLSATRNLKEEPKQEPKEICAFSSKRTAKALKNVKIFTGTKNGTRTSRPKNDLEPVPCLPEAENKDYTKQINKQSKEYTNTLYFKTWNDIAKNNPMLKDISNKRKKDHAQADKAIKELLEYWPELGIKNDLPLTPELFGNILHDALKMNWWFITKPDSIRTITMVLRRHNFEEAIGLLKINQLRQKG